MDPILWSSLQIVHDSVLIKGKVDQECMSLVRLRLLINISKSIDNKPIKVFIFRFSSCKKKTFDFGCCI